MNTEAYDNYAVYLRNQRHRYDKGLPSSHRPEDMVYWERNAEDLAWFLSDSDGDLTASAIEWAKTLFSFMDSHGGKIPSQKSKDRTEKVLGRKLSKMRTNKKNNKEGWPIYGSELLKLSKKRGYLDVFNRTDLTKVAMARAEELFEWMDSHESKTPSAVSKDTVEKALGSKLSTMRDIKKNNKRGWLIYGSKLMKLAKKRGYPAVFNRVDLTREALEWAEELFLWMNSHEDRAPSTVSKDHVEKSLGNKLSTMREKKKNNKDGWPLYGPKLLKLAKKRGYTDVFNTRGA
ncbi:hypothetical protein LCGC14_0244420 [marine sediment metagenome]|uniref:Uncharacterized protein n=1 Tax=marine sediment metagenome TaxID=412755 RepID=A0A0F9U6L3_9ZZZZ